MSQHTPESKLLLCGSQMWVEPLTHTDAPPKSRSEAVERKKSVGFKDRLLKLLVPFSVIAGVSSVLGFFGSFHYLVDFLANLRACFCLLFVMVALVAALLRDVRGTIICLAFLFINLATFVPFYINKPIVCPDKPQLRIPFTEYIWEIES